MRRVVTATANIFNERLRLHREINTMNGADRCPSIDLGHSGNGLCTTNTRVVYCTKFTIEVAVPLWRNSAIPIEIPESHQHERKEKATSSSLCPIPQRMAR